MAKHGMYEGYLNRGLEGARIVAESGYMRYRNHQIDRLSRRLPNMSVVSADYSVHVQGYKDGIHLEVFNENLNNDKGVHTIVDITRDDFSGSYIGVYAEVTDYNEDGPLSTRTYNTFSPQTNTARLREIVDSLRIASAAAERAARPSQPK
jgi:hypothetical protein